MIVMNVVRVKVRCCGGNLVVMAVIGSKMAAVAVIVETFSPLNGPITACRCGRLVGVMRMGVMIMCLVGDFRN